MTKQEQFLWIAQTTVLANALDLLSQTGLTEKAEISATDAFIAMDEAVRASELIPDTLTAAQAANEFCTFVLAKMHDMEVIAAGRPLAVPTWFVRHQ